MKDAIAQAAASQPQDNSTTVSGNIIPQAVDGRTVHIDGDYLAYFCGAVADSPGYARSMAHEYISNFKLFSGSTKAMVHLTAPFSTKGDRALVSTVKPYQANRKGTTKPDQWQFLRDYLTNYTGSSFDVQIWNDREADDGVAYMCTKNPDDAIATRDKDFRMIPGHHIDWQTLEVVHVPLGTFELVAETGLVFGHKWFWLQMLQGDTADNIPGLEYYTDEAGKEKRCGEKTAEMLLANAHSNYDAYKIVDQLYLNGYGNMKAERFCEQAILLWMRTDKEGSLGDFFSIIPYSTSEEPFLGQEPPGCGDSDLTRAFYKVYTRVEDMKDEAKNIAAKASTDSDAERTEW